MIEVEHMQTLDLETRLFNIHSVIDVYWNVVTRTMCVQWLPAESIDHRTRNVTFCLAYLENNFNRIFKFEKWIIFHYELTLGRDSKVSNSD